RRRLRRPRRRPPSRRRPRPRLRRRRRPPLPNRPRPGRPWSPSTRRRIRPPHPPAGRHRRRPACPPSWWTPVGRVTRSGTWPRPSTARPCSASTTRRPGRCGSRSPKPHPATRARRCSEPPALRTDSRSPPPRAPPWPAARAAATPGPGGWSGTADPATTGEAVAGDRRPSGCGPSGPGFDCVPTRPRTGGEMTTVHPHTTALEVDDGVYAPQDDSWLLRGALVASGLADGRRVLDLLTGSGILAIEAARRGAREVLALDISPAAVACAARNARLAGVDVDVRRGGLDDARAAGPYDLVLANPPYVPSDAPLRGTGPDRAWEAGADGRVVLDQLCALAPDLVAPGGAMLIVHSEFSVPARTTRMLSDAGLLTAAVATRV